MRLKNNHAWHSCTDASPHTNVAQRGLDSHVWWRPDWAFRALSKTWWPDNFVLGKWQGEAMDRTAIPSRATGINKSRRFKVLPVGDADTFATCDDFHATDANGNDITDLELPANIGFNCPDNMFFSRFLPDDNGNPSSRFRCCQREGFVTTSCSDEHVFQNRRGWWVYGCPLGDEKSIVGLTFGNQTYPAATQPTEFDAASNDPKQARSFRPSYQRKPL